MGDIRKHFWLAQRMAKQNGISLTKAVERGNLDHEGWAGMVHLCRGCSWTEGCERYLARRADPSHLPEHCRNRLRFGVLKALENLEGTA